VQKPSPVPSIILFLCAALLLYCAFGASWYSLGEEGGLGLMRGSFGGEGKFYIADKHIELESILGTMAGLFAFAAAVVSAIAGAMLLKPGKSMLGLFAVITVALAMVFALAFTGKVGHMASFGAAFYLFWLSSVGVLVSGIMGMTRAPAQATGMPMGYPQGYQMPPQQGYQQQGYQQPGYQQPQPQMPVTQCNTCGGPTMFVAQYNRQFCQRCNRYL
jgi:hypothetical protein